MIYCMVGGVAGILAGLLGIGGGLVIVPMLIEANAWWRWLPNPRGDAHPAFAALREAAAAC